MSLENRIPQLVQIASEESIRTGEKKSYFCNIIASPATSLRLAKLAIAGGVDVLIANAAVMSVGGLEDLVNGLDDGARVPVISTDMAVALMSRAPTHAHGKVTQTGMSEAIFAKLARLAGADGVHTGTVGSECYGEMEWNRTSRAISEPMRYIAPCFAVASSDLGLKQIWPNMSSLGPDLLFQVSSGIVNYPDGPEEGAQMFRKFLEQLDPINMDDDAADEAVAQIAAKNKTARIILDHSD